MLHQKQTQRAIEKRKLQTSVCMKLCGTKRKEHNSSLSSCKTKQNDHSRYTDNLRTTRLKVKARTLRKKEKNCGEGGVPRVPLRWHVVPTSERGSVVCVLGGVGGGGEWNEKCTHPIYERCGPGSLLAPHCGPQESRKTKSVSSLWFFASNGYR